MAEALPRPLVPATLDLSDLPGMMLDIERLRKSKAWLKAKRRPELGFYMLNLWMRAFHERPAASIENDDDVLADAAGCHPRDWEDVKEEVLRGWVLCSDGRLYHPTVAEKAMEALARRIGYKFGKDLAKHRQAKHRAEIEKRPQPAPLSFVAWLSQEEPSVLPYLVDIEPLLPKGIRDEISPSECAQGAVTVTKADVTVTKANVTVTPPRCHGQIALKLKLQDEDEGEDEFITDTLDRPEITQPLSDPRCGPDEVGGGSVRSKGEREHPAPFRPSAPSKPQIVVPFSEPALATAPEPHGGAPRADGANPRDDTDGFERFWQQAEPPKHAAKAKARAAWARTRHVRPPDDVLIACHAAYRASVAEENAKRRQERPPRAALSLCHPETFLSERRWEGFIGAAVAVPAPVIALQDWGERGRRLAAAIGGDAVFAAWFSEAAFVDGEPVTIAVTKPFQRKWIEDHYRQALERVFGECVRVVCGPAKAGALAA